jgi:hypothetical protein
MAVKGEPHHLIFFNMPACVLSRHIPKNHRKNCADGDDVQDIYFPDQRGRCTEKDSHKISTEDRLFPICCSTHRALIRNLGAGLKMTIMPYECLHERMVLHPMGHFQ